MLIMAYSSICLVYKKPIFNKLTVVLFLEGNYNNKNQSQQNIMTDKARYIRKLCK